MRQTAAHERTAVIGSVRFRYTRRFCSGNVPGSAFCKKAGLGCGGHSAIGDRPVIRPLGVVLELKTKTGFPAIALLGGPFIIWYVVWQFLTAGCLYGARSENGSDLFLSF
jgi:hypothetical protein